MDVLRWSLTTLTNSPSNMKSISVALSGKNVDVSKVFATTDELVTLLKAEQSDDDSKKAYCSKVFDETEDEAKMLRTTKMRSRTTSISCPTQTLVLRSRRSQPMSSSAAWRSRRVKRSCDADVEVLSLESAKEKKLVNVKNCNRKKEKKRKKGGKKEKRRKGEKAKRKKMREKQRSSTQLLHSTHTTQARQAQSWRSEASQPWTMCHTGWVPAGHPRYTFAQHAGKAIGGSTAQAQPPFTNSVRKF